MLLSSSKSQDFEKFNFFVNWSTRGGGPLEGTRRFWLSLDGLNGNPPFFPEIHLFFSEIHLFFLKSTFVFWNPPFFSESHLFKVMKCFVCFFGSIDHESTQNELLERIERQIHTELPTPLSRCVPGRASHLRARSRKWMTQWSDCFHSKVIF